MQSSMPLYVTLKKSEKQGYQWPAEESAWRHAVGQFVGRLLGRGIDEHDERHPVRPIRPVGLQDTLQSMPSVRRSRTWSSHQ